MFLLYRIIKTRKHSANIKKTFKFSLAAGVCWTHLSVWEAHLAHKQQSGEGNIWCLFACCEIGSQGTKPELRPQGFGIPPRRGTLPNTQERGHTSCFFFFFKLIMLCNKGCIQMLSMGCFKFNLSKSHQSPPIHQHKARSDFCLLSLSAPLPM